MSFDPRLIEPIVRSAVAKEPGRRFVAVRSDVLPAAPTELQVDGEAWEAHPVRSTLQARRVLARAGDEGRRVLVTTILDDELGPEVMARLAQNQVHRVEPWALVRDAFGAERIDQRVTAEGWMASALLLFRPAGGYPRARLGLVDLDTAWAALSRAIGFAGGEPTLDEWVVACVEEDLQARWGTFGESLRGGLARRLEQRHGERGALLAELLGRGQGGAIVPLALVAETIDAAGEGEGPLRAKLKLELAIGSKTSPALFAGEARSWIAQRIEAGQATSLEPVFDEVRRIAGECEATALLGGSAVLPEGAEARLEVLAVAVERALGGLAGGGAHNDGAFDGVESAAEAVLEHALVGVYPRLVQAREQAEATRRLVRWLRSEELPVRSVAEAATGYRDDGAWVDRLRGRLQRGGDATQWTAALRALGAAVRERRERGSRAFAESLWRATAGQEGDGGALPLEEVYARVVAPLAQEIRVLVVVLDGMSQAVFQEVAESIGARTSLRRMVQGSAQSWEVVLAPLPTVTEVARTSLLCGELTSGSASTEQSGQRALAQQFGWTRRSDASILFHKGALREGGGGLASEVLAAIESPARVVSVVVNAIDDLLPKGDQLDVRWGLETLKELEALIVAAEVEPRAVVLTADHGHVVETWEGEADAAHTQEKGERWRAPGRAPEGRELEFRGPRVLLPEPGGPVVLPWSEGLRYSSRHAGYHGGASPQEVVVPLGVFVPANALDGLRKKGWDEELVAVPWWWTDVTPAEPVSPAVEPVPEPARRPKAEPVGQATMFEEPAPAPAQTSAGTAGEGPAWLPALVGSAFYKAQLKAANVNPRKRRQLEELLVALDQLGGRATYDGLRQRLGLATPLFRPVVAFATAVLNVDGYSVIEVREEERTIALDEELLRQQFRLEGER